MTGIISDLTRIKTYMDITDTNDDTFLNQCMTVADQNANDVLSRFADVANPLSATDAAWATVQAIADFDVCIMYKTKLGQLVAASTWDTRRKSKIKDLEEYFATRTSADRFSPVAYAQTYRTNPLYTRTGL